MSEVEYPVGKAILAMILGIPGALMAGILRWAGLIDSNGVIIAWLVSGFILTIWLTELEN